MDALSTIGNNDIFTIKDLVKIETEKKEIFEQFKQIRSNASRSGVNP